MTIGQVGHAQWSCDSPQKFLQFMNGVHPNVKITPQNTWDSIVVVRNGQQLGTLQEVRQCFQLWENEMEKWGCNGLGEQLPDRNGQYLHLFPSSTAKLTMLSSATRPNVHRNIESWERAQASLAY